MSRCPCNSAKIVSGRRRKLSSSHWQQRTRIITSKLCWGAVVRSFYVINELFMSKRGRSSVWGLTPHYHGYWRRVLALAGRALIGRSSFL